MKKMLLTALFLNSWFLVMSQNTDKVIFEIKIKPSGKELITQDTMKVFLLSEKKPLIANKIAESKYEILLPRSLHFWIGLQCKQYAGQVRCLDNRNGIANNKTFTAELEVMDSEYTMSIPMFVPPCVRSDE